MLLIHHVMLYKSNGLTFCHIDLLLLLLLLYIKPIATPQPKPAIFNTTVERHFDPFTLQKQLITCKVD